MHPGELEDRPRAWDPTASSKPTMKSASSSASVATGSALSRGEGAEVLDRLVRRKGEARAATGSEPGDPREPDAISVAFRPTATEFTTGA